VTEHQISDFRVQLVSEPMPGGLTDATRAVESIGFSIVRVRTASGFEGIGVTYHEVGGEATKELILRDMAPRFLGRDPFATEEIYADMFAYLRGVGRKGLIIGALSAVDIALWDLKGKILDMSLYRLLGGSETRIPLYASGGWTSYGDDELLDEVQGMVDRGYSMVKFQGRGRGRDQPAPGRAHPQRGRPRDRHHARR